MSNPFLPIRRLRDAVRDPPMLPLLRSEKDSEVQELPMNTAGRTRHAPGLPLSQRPHAEVDGSFLRRPMASIAASPETHRKAGKR